MSSFAIRTCVGILLGLAIGVPTAWRRNLQCMPNGEEPCAVTRCEVGSGSAIATPKMASSCPPQISPVFPASDSAPIQEKAYLPWTETPVRHLSLKEAIAQSLQAGCLEFEAGNDFLVQFSSGQLSHVQAVRVYAGGGRLVNQGSSNEPSAPQVAEDDIVICTLHCKPSRAHFECTVNNMVLNVHVAYWKLYQAYGELVILQEQARLLQKAWLVKKAWLECQPLRNLDESRQRSFFLKKFAELRDARLTALGGILEAERSLRGVVGLPVEDGTRLVPFTEPVLASPPPDWNELIKAALTNRVEVVMLREQLRLAKLEMLKDCVNQAKNRLQLAKTYELFQDTEERITRLCVQQYQKSAEWLQRLETHTSECQAYEEASCREYLDQPNYCTVDLMVIVDQWATAMRKRFEAIGEYNNTLARLEWARGTLQQYHHVTISEGAFPERPMVRAVDHFREVTRAAVMPNSPSPFVQPALVVGAAIMDFPIAKAEETGPKP